ncbi:MAG: hypothetical protein H6863_06520 [Rhodospirillales bacterium]|nr:hypothetical protein [Rhodospirillales bacterium]
MYVQRDQQGNIKGIFRQMQPGIAEEFVEGAELPQPEQRKSEIDVLQDALKKKGVISQAEIDAERTAK